MTKKRGDKMQVEIDIEKLVTRSIIDGILNSDKLQEEVESILESDECQKILTEQVKARLNEVLLSAEGKEDIDRGIIDGIINSEKIQSDIVEILEGDEYEKILKGRVRTCLNEAIFSDEGKEQILCKIQEYLENYDLENDDDLSNELSKGLSDIMIIMMKSSFEAIKKVNRQ